MKTNRPIVWIAVMLMACLPLGGVAGAAESVDRYVWQTPRVSGIDREKVAPLLEELEFLVQQVLDAGPLAPLRTAYADIPFEAYYLYYERGRMITTLAWAYPHVAPTRQEGIRRYVRNLLADEQQAPWTPGILQKNQGAERRLYGRPVAEGRYVTYDKRAVPTLHVLYGLWLYGDRTGDWQIIQQNWDKIRGHYTRSAATEVFLYGQMSAHVAMARMAQRFGDAATLQIATAALAADLEAGRDTGVIEQRQRKTRYAWAYDERNAWASRGCSWMPRLRCCVSLRTTLRPGNRRCSASTQSRASIRCGGCIRRRTSRAGREMRASARPRTCSAWSMPWSGGCARYRRPSWRYICARPRRGSATATGWRVWCRRSRRTAS